ncbi:hypothetical protein C8F04DRAFT_1118121 [Mycena alexandri]|uniref:Uncharacterized protein n=1 Tax=Mycena alexandri TaxID=1745969 RepID=A0AAD6SKB6_9AGAR|nr:hypothetical protein C8F04DRAFT_1118121 [Mycena alexandri]
MSSNQSSFVMTSPVFRYAVLVVLSVVVVMGAGICYRTRVYQRRMHTLAANAPRRVGPPIAHEWGPKPVFFDMHLDMPKEKPESDWDEMMPISVARGALDASGASSLARISIMISMPFSGTFEAPEPLGDDERYPPHVEIGLSDIAVLLQDVSARRFDLVSDENKKES